jgi:HK97 family phage portal protein
LAVISLSRKTGKLEVIRTVDPTINVGSQSFRLEDLYPSIKKFYEFWDFMDAIHVHGYTRAAMSVIGRSAIGAWWGLRKHGEFGKRAREIQRKRLYSFYMMAENRAWNNIKDFQHLAYKLLIGVMYLRYFGQAAYQIVRNGMDQPIGLDFLPGLVVPNVDERGNFKEPAFVQYISRDPKKKVEFNDPRDVVFIATPDWEGSAIGSSDIEALANFAMPLDIYLQTAATSYMENRDVPEAIFQLSGDISDEAFDAFVKELKERFTGPSNLGRSPIAVKGELDVKELRSMPSALPYQDARDDTRKEILSVSGTSGSKLGLTEEMTNSNLREMRREFHETTMIPFFRFIELAFYEQVHVREFDIEGWEFKFNNPDFLNAVERATVDMRRHQMGAMNPNEIRYQLGMAPRKDELGDMYYDQFQLFMQEQMPTEPQGSPPEGREPEPDDPSQVGEPDTDADDPERGDQHDDTGGEDRALVSALRRWRAFAIKRVKRGRKIRLYESDEIPETLRSIIQNYLENARTIGEVVRLFDGVLDEVNRHGRGN